MMYFAYGLHIESEIHSPVWAEVSPLQKPDVFVKKVIKPFTGIWDKPASFCKHREDGSFIIGLKDIALFEILNPYEVNVTPCKDSDPQTVALFLSGTAISIILTMRGLYVFHGNAAKIGEGCVIVTGASGAGKSTVAIAFLNANLPLLSDDVCVIDAKQNPPLLYPSYPSLKLWRTTLELLEIPSENLTKIGDRWDKFHVPINDGFWPTPLPISHVFLLEKSETLTEVSLEPLNGIPLFKELMRNAHRIKFIHELGMSKQQFDWASRLSQHVKGGKITRPDSKMVANEIVNLIQKEVLNDSIQK